MAAKIHFISLTLSASLLGAPIVGIGNSAQTPRTRPRQNRTDYAEEHTREHMDSFMEERTYGSGNIPESARSEAWDYAKTMEPPEVLPQRESMIHKRRIGNSLLQIGEQWRHVGPIGILTGKGEASGRINTVAISPADQNLILIGSATGGIWRSVNGGQTFVPVSDDIAGLSVGSIAFYRDNPSIVYAGMGDPVYGYLGHGVLKSTDSGQTWRKVNDESLKPPCTISKIEVDPSSANLVYLTQGAALGSTNPENCGFYLSTDGGVQWKQTLHGAVHDLAVDTAGSKTFYVAIESSGGAFGKPAGIYRSTDSGETWTTILNLTTAGGAISRVPFDSGRDLYVRVALTGHNFIYVLASGSISNQAANVLLSSSDGGASWKSLRADSIDAVQPYWDLYLSADPRRPKTLYAGAIDIYKSTNAGATWRNLTRNVKVQSPPDKVDFSTSPGLLHVDQHALVFPPQATATIYAANDGGLFKSTNSGRSFKSLNRSLSLTQFNSLALDPGNAKFVYGGTQDNGTLMAAINARGRLVWRRILGSDGGRCAVCQPSAKRLFATRPSGPISLVHHGEPRATVKIAGFMNDRKLPIYPLVLGKDARLYVGTYRLWVSSVGCHELDPDDATEWTAPAGNTDLTNGNPDKLAAIAVADSDPNVIYTGSSRARVMKSTDGGVNWTDISRGLPNRFVSSITADHTKPALVFVTFSGFTSAPKSSHVFKTTDGGATWIDISNGLPNIPVNAFIIDPRHSEQVYVGTDIGVFKSPDLGKHWVLMNNGMPPVIVKAFAIGPRGRIVAATFGRGVYVLEPPRRNARG